MSNEHLVPVVIQDLVHLLLGGKNSSFTQDSLVQRLEAIRDYCERALQKFEQQRNMRLK